MSRERSEAESAAFLERRMAETERKLEQITQAVYALKDRLDRNEQAARTLAGGLGR
jgi:prefoldin subunit 5